MENLITANIDHSENTNLEFTERKEKLKTAYKLIRKIKEDSLKTPYYLDLVHAYYKLPDTSNFLELNRELLKLAKKTKDSAVVAKCYWRLGNYNSDFNNRNDSAFYYYNKAQDLYQSIGNEINAARLLINMAIIQTNIKDYTGSEITTTRAIALLKPIKAYRELYGSYNNLGIIFNELGEYERAIFYHQKALEYLEMARLPTLVAASKNNIGVVYNNKGDYNQAIENFESGLDHDSLYYHDTQLYAMLLDNLAYAKFKLNDTAGLPGAFYDALKIRDSIEHYNGITINKLHLSEYFLSKKDTLKALMFIDEALTLSKRINNNRDYLASLLLLSRADPHNKSDYMADYIKMNDSLHREERAIRNKFARIRFETDEYISETERLNQRVFRISLISLGALLIFALLYMIKDQRSRNKFIKQKQSANQEIYNLILSQQRKFEEGREDEKQHISRELHDGILGRLFGVRLSLDSLNDEDNIDSKKKRFEYIEEIQDIAEEIRLISHRLNKSSIIEVDFKIVLQELIKKQTQKIHLRIDNSINWEKVENDIKINFYRIIQEAINNIYKHANATKAKVEISKEKDNLILEVWDNGLGFNADQLKVGIGLENMKSRSQNIKGVFKIKSDQEGTLIKVSINMKKR